MKPAPPVTSTCPLDLVAILISIQICRRKDRIYEGVSFGLASCGTVDSSVRPSILRTSDAFLSSLSVRAQTSPVSVLYMRQPIQSGIIQMTHQTMRTTGLTRMRYQRRWRFVERTMAD